jgi:nucleoside-diphosphate-sugar epimerase
MIKRVLVTGANGFVGRRVCTDLTQAGFEVIAAVRNVNMQTCKMQRMFQWVKVGDLSSKTEWCQAMSYKPEAVIHLAAKVHELRGQSNLAAYQQVNVQGTACLALEAAKTGVKRFLFMSSMKTLGEGQLAPYTDQSLEAPDFYAKTKLEAEHMIQALGNRTGMEWVIFRPPLIYGPGVKANFYRLMSAVDRGIPLPLGSLHNKRSFLFIGNLVDAIRIALTHSQAVNKNFILTDGEALSTSEWVQKIATALNRRPRLISVPSAWLFLAGQLMGKSPDVHRLLGNFIGDNRGIQERLGWLPPYTIDQGMKETAYWFCNQRNVHWNNK